MKLSPKFARMTKTIATAALPLALGSMTIDTTDPSLLAAPVYEPEKWNDVSNEDLALFYERHHALVEKIILEKFEYDNREIALHYPLSSHRSSEKALMAILELDSYFKMPQNSFGPVSQWIAQKYNVRQYDAASAISDAMHILKPLHVQLANNCFAYAANDRDVDISGKNYDAAPGQRTLGLAPNPFEENYETFVRATIRGSISDGMIFTGKFMGSREGFYRVALYIRQGVEGTKDIRQAHEYHYVRQNRDGTWSHKFGGQNVTDTDYTGQKITDPSRANMGAYRFTAYFLVPEGGLDVGMPDEKSTKPGSRPAWQPH